MLRGLVAGTAAPLSIVVVVVIVVVIVVVMVGVIVSDMFWGRWSWCCGGWWRGRRCWRCWAWRPAATPSSPPSPSAPTCRHEAFMFIYFILFYLFYYFYFIIIDGGPPRCLQALDVSIHDSSYFLFILLSLSSLRNFLL